MKCPQCKHDMEKRIFNAGYGVEVLSNHCPNCMFNVTDQKILKKALKELRSQMKKEVKIVGVGTGLGIRFPNHIAQSLKLKKGAEVELTPVEDGIKIKV